MYRTLIAAATFLVFASVGNATDYLFRVSCSQQVLVAEWNTGSLDPGREYLRVATGTHFPNCSVGDYDPLRDVNLPRERYSHEGGVISGIPFVGRLACQLIRWC